MPLSRPCAALLGALLASSLCGRRGEAEAVATAAAGDDDVHRRHARLAPRTTYRGAPRRRKPGPQKKPPPKKKKKSPQKKKKKKKSPQQKKNSPNRRSPKEKEDPFEVTITRPSRLTRRPAPRPTPKPTPAPTPWPTARPTRMPTRMPTRRPVGGRGSGTASRPDGAGNKDKDKGKSHDKGKGKANPAAQRVLDRVSAEADYIDTQLFLYETPMRQWVPSTIYQTRGLVKGLEVMNTHGVAGMHYYLGDKGDGDRADAYGLTNLAAFLAQSMKETIKYDACSENSWDLVGGVYPLSNSCGQLGQSYQVSGVRRRRRGLRRSRGTTPRGADGSRETRRHDPTLPRLQLLPFFWISSGERCASAPLSLSLSRFSCLPPLSLPVGSRARTITARGERNTWSVP